MTRKTRKTRKTPPALWLDYQRPAPGRHRLGQVLAIVGVALALPLFAEHFSVSAELAAAESRVAKLRRDVDRRQLFARAAEPAAADAAGARPAPPSADRWEALLSSLEKAGDESVTLLALTPGAREVSIAGEAGTLAASIDYLKRVQTSPVLTDAHLAAYEVVTSHPQRPVRFTLVADWREGQR